MWKRNFNFGTAYDNYLNKPKKRTIDEVEKPKSYNGSLLVDFDEEDKLEDFKEEFKKSSGS